MAKFSQIKGIELAAEPNTDLASVLGQIQTKYDDFKASNSDAELVQLLPIGPVQENGNWGMSLVIFYTEP